MPDLVCHDAPSSLSQPVCWDNAAASFYLESIARSDYEQRVGQALRQMIGRASSLLDVGAGSGVPGAALLTPGAHWTAIEPNPLLAGYLADRPESPMVHRIRWQQLASMAMAPHAVVLAANMPGPLDTPEEFLDTLLPLTRHTLAWVVPAQPGPRRYCLSDFMPASVHEESCIPAVDLVLDNLSSRHQPHQMRRVDWTFRARFPSRAAAREHFEQRFNDADCANTSEQIQQRLARLTPARDGSLEIAISKRSACLVWRR